MPIFAKSEALLERTLKNIPLGSQTFSKSITQYPFGVSPYFLTHGQGSHVWDVDGNEYIDFVLGLGAITLGYNDPDVNEAVVQQLNRGVIFSLPHPVEGEVAEKIISMVPCAEMVRFGKNGSDVTTGAIRLARAYTGRDHVALCGYHGWHDWYIGTTTRNLGVPEATRALSRRFEYNDLDSLQRLFDEYSDEIAAVIMEPMSSVDPDPGFLEGVKELSHKNGSVLIFDEIVTGFRYANGGAQEYYGVTPDLATFGKCVANGYPLSVLTGRREIMKRMEDIFFSFTFGGETLSLAASLATLRKLSTESVIENLVTKGNRLMEGVRNLIASHKVNHFTKMQGHPTRALLVFKDIGPYSLWDIKTLCLQELLARGILSIGTHILSYATTDHDIQRLLEVYDEVFAILHDAVEKEDVHNRLKCQPLHPLFQVRKED